MFFFMNSIKSMSLSSRILSYCVSNIFKSNVNMTSSPSMRKASKICIKMLGYLPCRSEMKTERMKLPKTGNRFVSSVSVNT